MERTRVARGKGPESRRFCDLFVDAGGMLFSRVFKMESITTGHIFVFARRIRKWKKPRALQVCRLAIFQRLHSAHSGDFRCEFEKGVIPSDTQPVENPPWIPWRLQVREG